MSARLLSFSLAALLLSAPAAFAQNAIGEVALAEKDVTGSFGGKSGPLKNAERIVQNEVVATGAYSYARLAFHDQTSLAIGPQARVTLDRYVYNPDSTARQVSLNATRGAFRFITGTTPSKNITIRTPSATIGVRGTVIDFKIRPGREIVVLQQGATRVCAGSNCRDITVPGQGVIISGRTIEGPSTAAAAEFRFDAETGNRFGLFAPLLNPQRGESGGGGSQSGSSGSSGQSAR